MSNASHINGIFDHGKHKKMSIKQKWTKIEYHAQKNEDIEHRYVTFYFTTNQFPQLPFFGPHNKPRVVCGLIKHYHMHFETKLGCGTCAIRCITSVFTLYESILDKPWTPGMTPYQQAHYQPVKDCTCRPLLGSLIQLKHD